MDIIRDMIVADRGSPRQFRKGPLPDDAGPDTIGRLRRAGALPAEVKAEMVEPVAAVRKGKK
ncbi:hypothetical protein [Mesorhizobium sp.]|uniref:hypothetical protein n=1 Tax=Mesorhizobium sp. TaxID=1871066 RepID=UPI0025BCD5F7|nr:hypothetical protein [Mesorhizobium sp.]